MLAFIKMVTFNKEACIVRKVYCGEGSIPAPTKTVKYSRKGTGYECLQKGVGIAQWEHRKKTLSIISLQQLTYIGPVYEANFKKQKITSLPTLVKKLKNKSAADKHRIIRKACTRKDQSVDQRAVNSVLLFLYTRGTTSLPNCKIVQE
jgi:hypothetical protein